MFRTIYFGNPAYLHCHERQMRVIDPASREEIGSIAIEDIGFVVLDHPQITLTHYLMTVLIQARAVIISCDDHHLPLALMHPFAGHSEHTERLLLQTKVTEPRKKQLWQQTVKEKLHNQGRLLDQYGHSASVLLDMIGEVKSGDSTNREGVSAKYYWSQLFDDFTRDRYGDPPNSWLNYGYAILRSVMARALSSAGFHLALGIHHRSKYNATCLADDLMEPFRPYVDDMVLDLIDRGTAPDRMDLEVRSFLLTLMTRTVRIEGKDRTLQMAATITAASYYKCLKGQYRYLRYPIR